LQFAKKVHEIQIKKIIIQTLSCGALFGNKVLVFSDVFFVAFCI